MLREFLVDDDRAMFYTEQYTNGEKTTSEYHAILNEKKPYDIVTLVNGNSASASEVFASSMQEHGGYKLVGEVTFGKGTMQQDRYVESTCTENTFGTLDCSEADRIHISIGTWYTTNHNWVHFDGGSDGITPDILVEKSENELLYKLFLLNDETLEFDTVDDRTVIVQKILNIMGYDVRTDGYFDQETYDAIIDIQSNNGLTETGIINNETMSILNEALDNYKNNPTNDTQLQEAINYLTN
jgi:carboxyl-terminal processing protease